MRSVISLFLLCISFSSYGKATDKPIVILLSIDGFSFEYLNNHKPRNLLNFSKAGVLGKLQPVYPSKTFPNHLSIITGTYPITHGITNNQFYSRKLEKMYYKGAGKTNSKWLTAQPFWSFAQQKALKSAVYFWPESDAMGEEPTYNIPFNRIDSNRKRLAKIIEWLKLPAEERPHFIASYFSTVDSVGHVNGPDSKELDKAIENIDGLLGSFVAEVQATVNSEVNFILVSDHGMVKKDPNKIIKPSMIFSTSALELINKNNIVIAKNDTQLYLYFNKPNLTKKDKIALQNELLQGHATNDLYQLYFKGTYPDHWHLNEDILQVPDMIFEALPPATFVSEDFSSKKTAGGTHGYDALNRKELMGIFIAFGPSIKKSDEIHSFENIHVFPFMTELLGLEQSQSIDGNEEVLSHFIIK